MTLVLSEAESAMLHGQNGQGAAMAMKLLAIFSDALGAQALLPISGAHVDGCLYHGQAGLDFVEVLVAKDARVRVPTTLNVGSLDLIHPDLVTMDAAARDKPFRLMKAHEKLGCIPSFTCAPYQALFRPKFGDQIAWGESNAIVFSNSVIGARTNRYGDFMDLCCAITGYVPAWGLHLDANRRGQMLFQLVGYPDPLQATDSLFIGVGLVVGAACGDLVPVIEGLPQPRDEDQLKALGAAAASTGAVGLFHAVGITPEAPTREAALQGTTAEHFVDITPELVGHALARLSTVPEGTPVAAVCLGTPHFSHAEWRRLAALLHEWAPNKAVPIYVNTGRATLQDLQAQGLVDDLEQYGVIAVVDTCTYVTPILRQLQGAAMTNSGKWAYYAPSNIGCRVAFGNLESCVASAAAGRVVRLAG